MAAKDVKPWIITGYVFTALYLFLGLMMTFTQDSSFTTALGVLILIVGALFGAGSLLATNGKLGAARVLMTIGGILALPLGVVMIIAGAKFAAAAPSPRPPSILA